MPRLLSTLAMLLAASASLSAAEGASHASRPNVLLILVDDLKPTLGCYGDPAARTPHIDALAARGLRFDLAYCNQAVCAPSRFSLMLGSHPTSTGLYDLSSNLRKSLPKEVFDREFALEGTAKLVAGGGGADRQRRSFAERQRGRDVVDLLTGQV